LTIKLVNVENTSEFIQFGVISENFISKKNHSPFGIGIKNSALSAPTSTLDGHSLAQALQLMHNSKLQYSL
jgi:hypothetical protein